MGWDFPAEREAKRRMLLASVEGVRDCIEAVYGADALQRCWRDLNTAAQHFMVSDTAYENHGRFLLGLPDAKPFG